MTAYIAHSPARQYPKRRPYWAQRVIRAAFKTCAAQTVGADAIALLSIIATTEDAKRYRGAVTFFNEQLMAAMGVRKWSTFDAIRRRLIDAGWLHYDAPPAGSRRLPGSYWTMIPEHASDLPDTPMDEGDPIETAYLRGYADGKANRTPAPYPQKGYGREQAYPENGDGRGDGRGEPSILSLSPNTSPGTLPDEPTRKPGRRQRAQAVDPADLDTAQWFWQQVLTLQPGRKVPKLEQWADEIRLMRERDGRSHAEIRELFSRVQRDPFWRINILAPAKLREKWDDLQLKLGHGPARTPPPAANKPIPTKIPRFDWGNAGVQS